MHRGDTDGTGTRFGYRGLHRRPHAAFQGAEALLNLHKAVLNVERKRYELNVGPVANEFEFFGWRRAIRRLPGSVR